MSNSRLYTCNMTNSTLQPTSSNNNPTQLIHGNEAEQAMAGDSGLNLALIGSFKWDGFGYEFALLIELFLSFFFLFSFFSYLLSFIFFFLFLLLSFFLSYFLFSFFLSPTNSGSSFFHKPRIHDNWIFKKKIVSLDARTPQNWNPLLYQNESFLDGTKIGKGGTFLGNDYIERR